MLDILLDMLDILLDMLDNVVFVKLKKEKCLDFLGLYSKNTMI